MNTIAGTFVLFVFFVLLDVLCMDSTAMLAVFEHFHI